MFIFMKLLNKNFNLKFILTRIIFGGKEGEGKKKFVNDVHVLNLEKFHWEGPIKV